MNTRSYIALILFLFSCSLHALPYDGMIAPNFKAKDINGVEHELYDILAEGKTVILDFVTTWCPPCWTYHESGALEEYYQLYGENGTNESQVFFIEIDEDTDFESLQGTGNSTLGDWISGTSYPIIDDKSIGTLYTISGIPRIIRICQDRRIKLLPSLSAQELYDSTSVCEFIESAPEIQINVDKQFGCNYLEVQFSSTSWPRPFFVNWTFGDGITSNKQNPIHLYSNPGNYSVKVIARNEYGESEAFFEDFIQIEEGEMISLEEVGHELPLENEGVYLNEIGSLVFDAFDDIILNSVRVRSNRWAEREIVLMDSTGSVLQSRKQIINEGIARVPLNFHIPKGSNYKLGLKSQAHLLVAEAGVEYPYELEDLVRIKGTSDIGFETKYYHYFYDWAVAEARCDNINSIERSIDNLLQISPNPTSGIFQIELDTHESINHELTIYDIHGKKVKSKTLTSNILNLDIQELPVGIYFVQLRNAEGQFLGLRKLVVI